MDDKTVSSAIVRFSARFLDELDKSRSVVSSPISAEILLALIALGSTGKAHSELLTALGFPDDDAIRTAFAQLTERLKNIKDVTLDVNNKICINKCVELEPQSQKDAEEVFNSSFEVMDFNDRAAVAKNINDWVDKKTHHMIQKILEPSDVKPGDLMILINAIYFKGIWRYPFNKSKTSEKEFYVDDNTIMLVQMMTRCSSFKYARCDKLEAEFLVLPYVGDDAKMAIILPYGKEPESVNNILKKIADGYDLMEKIITGVSKSTIVCLPKFKIETEIKLKDVLQQLGIKSIFEQTYDLKMVKTKRPTCVSKAIQKAVIEVNEEGTEAAACTKTTKRAIKKTKNLIFNANHPFLYVLIGPGDTPLFVGVYRGDENAPRARMGDKRSEDNVITVEDELNTNERSFN